jgi:transcription initiation factor TFIIIB Brf1 subunit/transcription initiation factor TFIIB
MSDFNPYNELFDFFPDEIDIGRLKAEVLESDPECDHEDFFEEDGRGICKRCGCEIESLDFQPEWRYYGSSDNRSYKDPSRCHRSRETTRGGIDKVFVDAGLGSLQQAIKKKTEMKYQKIVGDETVRGNGRKAIVAACLLYVFRDDGDIRTSDEVRHLFGLSKCDMSIGLTKYFRAFPGDRTKHIHPSDMIRRIMNLVKIDISHYKGILRIAKCLENADDTLNHSSPQSVASAIVYLYLCLTPTLKESLGMTKTKFATKVALSDITISKLVRRVAEILNCQISM